MSCMNTLNPGVRISGFGLLLNLGFSGSSVRAVLAFLARKFSVACVSVSIGSSSSGVNHPGCLTTLPCHSLAGESWSGCWGVSSQKPHAASNDVMSFGFVLLVNTVLSHSLLNVFTAFSAAPLDCGWVADDRRLTIMFSSKNSSNSFEVNSRSPSVARHLGHVLRWKNVDSLRITDLELGPGVLFPSTITFSLWKWMYVAQFVR